MVRTRALSLRTNCKMADRRGLEQFERYGCPEPVKLSDLVRSNSCECDANRDFFVERNGSPTKV